MVGPPKRFLWRHPGGRIYVRLKGKLHRISAPEGTADFDRQYWEILTGKRMQSKTSWAALMDDYRKSDRWTGLKPRTRSDYDKVMDYLRDKIGRRDVKALTRADVIAAQAANTHRTRFANYIPRCLSFFANMRLIRVGYSTILQRASAHLKPLKFERKFICHGRIGQLQNSGPKLTVCHV